jgi:hypothetical protein
MAAITPVQIRERYEAALPCADQFSAGSSRLGERPLYGDVHCGLCTVLPAGLGSGSADQQRSGARKTRAQRCRSPVFHQGLSKALAPGHDLEQPSEELRKSLHVTLLDRVLASRGPGDPEQYPFRRLAWPLGVAHILAPPYGGALRADDTRGKRKVP